MGKMLQRSALREKETHGFSNGHWPATSKQSPYPPKALAASSLLHKASSTVHGNPISCLLLSKLLPGGSSDMLLPRPKGPQGTHLTIITTVMFVLQLKMTPTYSFTVTFQERYGTPSPQRLQPTYYLLQLMKYRSFCKPWLLTKPRSLYSLKSSLHSGIFGRQETTSIFVG